MSAMPTHAESATLSMTALQKKCRINSRLLQGTTRTLIIVGNRARSPFAYRTSCLAALQTRGFAFASFPPAAAARQRPTHAGEITGNCFHHFPCQRKSCHRHLNLRVRWQQTEKYDGAETGRGEPDPGKALPSGKQKLCHERLLRASSRSSRASLRPSFSPSLAKGIRAAH